MKALKLALLSIAAVLAAPTFAAQPEHLDVPTLNDAFRRLADSEAAAERTTPFGWNDGENRIFRRGEWKFSFNDREITQIRTPKDADVRQFAYFLLKEPWRKRLSPRLREGAELTPGERMAIRVVYLAWIDSLRQLASLGYQHVSFHTCVNSRDFPKSQGKKNVSFGDGSIYGDLKQRFFDRIPGGEKDVAALSGWGASFLEPRNDRRDLLKRIIHRGDEKFVSAMRLKQLNEYFYVEPRVSDFTGELTVIGGMGVDQIASWRDIVGEVLREIGVLASIKDDIGSWRDTFEAKTLSEKDASDLDEEMARLVAELDGANEEAVRRARLVFFDYPLVRACAVFRRDVGKSTSIIYSAETEQENLRNAVRSFLGNIAGTGGVRHQHADRGRSRRPPGRRRSASFRKPAFVNWEAIRWAGSRKVAIRGLPMRFPIRMPISTSSAVKFWRTRRRPFLSPTPTFRRLRRPWRASVPSASR